MKFKRLNSAIKLKDNYINKGGKYLYRLELSVKVTLSLLPPFTPYPPLSVVSAK
jgi:hypothetical protein